MQQPQPTACASSKWHKLYNAFNNPKKKESHHVILRFFNIFTLTEIREGFNDWFFDTLQEDNSGIKQYPLLYNDIQKMIEAVYTLAREVWPDDELLPDK